MNKAQKFGSAIPGRPVFDTLKSVNNLFKINFNYGMCSSNLLKDNRVSI